MLRYMKTPELQSNGFAHESSGYHHEEALSSAPHNNMPPPPLASRQALMEATKIPVPLSTDKSNGTHLSSRHHGLRPSHLRTNSENDAVASGPLLEPEQQIWEDSTVNSMLALSASGEPMLRNAAPHYKETRPRRDVGFEGQRPDSLARLFEAPTSRSLPQLPRHMDPEYFTQDDHMDQDGSEHGTSMSDIADEPEEVDVEVTPPRKSRPVSIAAIPMRSERRPVQQQQQQQHHPSTPRRSAHVDEEDEGEVQNTHKRRLSPDYDDAALTSMSYTDLLDEAFDHDPARAATQAASSVVPTAELSLPEKLAHYRDQDESSQQDFFARMSVSEWDESGDWFLEQFGSIVEQMRKKRQEKRRLVADFEREIAEREEMVRLKHGNIVRTLEDLRKDGEGMMKGKAMPPSP